MAAFVSGRFLRTGFSILLLGALLLIVPFEELLAALRHISMSGIALLIFVSFVLIYISVVKWRIFLQQFGAEVSLARLFNLYLLGYFVNTIMPSWIGGDAVRSWYLGKKIGQHEAAAATVLERYTGLLAMVLLAALTMWFTPLVTDGLKLTVGLLTVGLVVASLVALSQRFVDAVRRVPFVGLRTAPHLAKVQTALALGMGRPGLLARAMVLSFAFHLCAVLNTGVAGYVVGWSDIPWVALCVVVPLVLLIGAIPISPAGLGIQEGAFFFFLTGVGASPGEALALGLVLRAKTFLLGGLGWFSWQYERMMAVRESSKKGITHGEET